jgi:hypothetical protein
MMHSGRSGRLISTFISLLIASGISGQEGKSYKYLFNGNLNNGVIATDNQSFILNYSLNELNITSITTPHGEFYRINIPGHNTLDEPGKPELPVLSRLINIPDGAFVNVRISEVKSERVKPADQNFNGRLYPKQPGAIKSDQDNKADFVMDAGLYSRNAAVLTDTVKIENLGKVRKNQLATIQVFPVNYNPVLNELYVITSMKIEVTFTPSGNNPAPLKSASLLFSESVSKGVLNYNPSDVVTGYSDQPVKMILISDPAFKNYLTPFIKWKTQQGYRITTMYKTTNLTTFTQFKDSINKIYSRSTATNPAPEYILIVGDVNRIPKSEGNGTSNITDMYYGEFDGNGDYIPDMYVGRIPASDTSGVKAALAKIIQYEKFQYADTNKFYKRTLATAGNDGGYVVYMNGQVKYEVANYLNSSRNIDGYSFYYPQSSSSLDSIKKLMKKGLGFINYSGHGDASGWLGPALRSSDISLISNKDMYPFIITNACRTAEFSTAGSFGNTTIITPDKGAVGYIGCSNDSYWDEDYYWSVGVGTPTVDPKYTETGLGALDRLFHTHGESPSDWFLTMGQINYAGNLAVSQSTSSRKRYYWETYTMLGDPSAIPYIGVPDSFKVALPDTIPNGLTSLALTIPPFSYIAISHSDTLWDASYASPSGSVVLDLPGRSDDSCLIVISGQNKIPLIKKIKIRDVKREFVNLTAVVINDAGANNNGLADYGESLYLKLVINNLGKSALTGLYARLTNTSGLITLNNDSVYIGPMDAKSQVILPVCFGMKVSNLITDRTTVTFDLKIADDKVVKNYKVDVCLHAPVLEIINCTIDDSDLGNGNYIAEPGERFFLNFKVRNSGSSNISGTMNIQNQPPVVSIFNPTLYTGTISYGAITTIPVMAQLASDAPKGGAFDISTILDCAPYVKTKPFNVPIGRTRESFEYQSLKIYPWINSTTYPWIITGTQAYEGQYSARSGSLPNYSESLLKLKLNVPIKDTLKFYAKVSSEKDYDFLIFRINGREMFRISGETNWSEYKYELKEGFNILEWDYKKDESVSSGADCAWIDWLRFPNTAFSRVDLKTGKIVTPQPGKSLNQETITAEVINLGTDTIKTFNLAYQVNFNTPVIQNFVRKINPSDTAVVAFTQPANLIGNGSYNISVYGLYNGDYFLKNDTSRLLVVNTGIFDHVSRPSDQIKVMPNPFKTSFRIELESNVSETADISIIGPSGNILWNEKRYIIPGNNILTIDPAWLSDGYYTLKISGKSISRIARIIKIR